MSQLEASLGLHSKLMFYKTNCICCLFLYIWPSFQQPLLYVQIKQCKVMYCRVLDTQCLTSTGGPLDTRQPCLGCVAKQSTLLKYLVKPTQKSIHHNILSESKLRIMTLPFLAPSFSLQP